MSVGDAGEILIGLRQEKALSETHKLDELQSCNVLTTMGGVKMIIHRKSG